MSLLETLVPPLRRAREQVEELEGEVTDLEQRVDTLTREKGVEHRRRLRAESRLNDAQARLGAGLLPLCPECGTTTLRDLYKTWGLDEKYQYQCENHHNLTVYGRFADVRVTSRETR